MAIIEREDSRSLFTEHDRMQGQGNRESLQKSQKSSVYNYLKVRIAYTIYLQILPVFVDLAVDRTSITTNDIPSVTFS